MKLTERLERALEEWGDHYDTAGASIYEQERKAELTLELLAAWREDKAAEKEIPMTDDQTKERCANALANYFNIVAVSKTEEHTDIGDLWDVARELAETCLEVLGKDEDEINSYVGMEGVLDAAFKVFGKEYVMNHDDPVTWIDGALEGTYRSIGDWANQYFCKPDMRDMEPFVDWEAYGAIKAKKDNLSWAKGGEGIYLFDLSVI